MTASPPSELPSPWQELLAGAGLMVGVVDQAGRVLLANRAMRDACGRGDAGASGLQWPRDFVATVDQAEAAEALARWIGGDPAAGAVELSPLERGGAAVRRVRWHGTSWSTAAGVALLGVDVSAERAQEAKLLRTTRFYRALSDMNAAVGRLQDASALYRAVCEIAVDSGHALMAWVGLRDGEFLAPVAWGGNARDYTRGLALRLEGGPQPRGPSSDAFASGRPSICNDVDTDPRMAPWREHARAFGVRSSAAFPILRDGRPIGTLNLYFADRGAFDEQLTDLAQRMVSDVGFALAQIDREQARAEAERLAQERELQLSGLVESALDAIIAIDARQRVVLFNAAATRMFGVTAEAAIGGTLDRFIPPDERRAHRHAVDRYAAEGQTSRRMGLARELTGLRANGDIFPMEASISRSGEGERLLMTVMVRDVTHMRRAESERAARMLAEAANKAKTEFLSRMSHELRTPLNAILGFSQLLRADARDPLSARHRERVELVIQAGEHLRSLIEEMLDVSGIEAGRVAVVTRDFELREVLDGVLRMSAPHAAECGIRLEPLYAPDETMPVRGDPSRVRQIVLNVVSNAIKYNRGGGRVQVGFERTPQHVRILVRDDGLGMTPAQLAQLFQPFNRLGREGGAAPGMGIGLVLVRQLARLLGGEVSVESASGQGTTVCVTLPAAAGPPAPRDEDEAAGAVGDGHVAGRVLYIEDNPVNAMLVEQMLARWPRVEVTIAEDGESGLERARATLPQVVLLDMQLPDISGLEVLRRLRAHPLTRDVPIIALSASGMPDEVHAARSAGADDYWTKPVDLGAFLANMHELLTRRGAAPHGSH
ncbi:MAG TPA: ATP-binding protein [Burkholderiaceae bacterium]